MTTGEQARRVVDAYAKGLICAGEVFNNYLDHISPETIDDCMSLLSPELIQRFERGVGPEFEVDYPLAKAENIERWRHARALIADWLGRRSPEPCAAANGGGRCQFTENRWVVQPLSSAVAELESLGSWETSETFARLFACGFVISRDLPSRRHETPSGTEESATGCFAFS